MIVHALAVIALLSIGETGADDSKLPAGYTCEQVRAYVAEYGKIAAYAWAKLNGATGAQISAAKRCLK